MFNNITVDFNLIKDCDYDVKRFIFEHSIKSHKFNNKSKSYISISRKRKDHTLNFSKTNIKKYITEANKGNIEILNIKNIGKFEFEYKGKYYFSILELLSESIKNDKNKILEVLNNKNLFRIVDKDLQNILHYLILCELCDPKLYLFIFTHRNSNITDFKNNRPIDLFFTDLYFSNKDDVKHQGFNYMVEYVINISQKRKKILIATFENFQDDLKKLDVFKLIKHLFFKDKYLISGFLNVLSHSNNKDVRKYIQNMK